MKNKITLMLLLPISFIIFYPSHQLCSDSLSEMQVHFIDVGQGDSILIQTPTEKTILIDGGPPKAGKKVVAYLNKLGINNIDLLIATHPDVDHIGGLKEVMKAVKVKQILDSGKLHFTNTYANYALEIRKQGIPTKVAKTNDRIQLDPELRIKVLNSNGKNKNNNQSSLVLKISFKKMDFLLMGDVEMEQEKNLLENHNLEAEIIKIAHHGSDTSSAFRFLNEVNPQIAILTYRIGNDYGHPVKRVINNLDRIDAQIYSTGVFGSLRIITNGENYMIIPEKSPIENIAK
ncbi:ComEC/Rec2 family competence protein [Oceanobacillus chungangensis]|uniref:Competence protein n=1 Tax=Oceanobacillus chungangensis TaxID=1229152 RepID=A0A3D8PM45_9BACI|nr:MBL fold metallo-hydrolase [Oceanobacillus chungangensis]RDW17196.1 competence protein [Oceanobacillus chungangensis]